MMGKLPVRGKAIQNVASLSRPARFMSFFKAEPGGALDKVLAVCGEDRRALGIQ